ncbi:MAG: metallo beta-lactamase family protein [Parcubacteria group bacterium Gr01-1014_3]|nr:MAG: metallo beta-lactamase family protein [Parcubacteria group bacterium Gr01-1014_3]
MLNKNSKAKKSNWVLYIVAALLLLDGIVWYQIIQASTITRDSARIYFLDVGQGDSQLIIFPGGPKLLIDAGNPDGKVLTALAKVLPPQDRYIDMLLMTHPQLDHFGGFIDVLKNYEVGAFIGNGRKGTAGAYQTLINELQNRGVPYIQLAEEDRIIHEDTALGILSPNSGDLLSSELNDTSLVTMLRDKNFKILFTADIGFNVENELMKRYDLSADILKVGHHGSRFSSGAEFLAAVKPKAAIIEVGKNTYGHPTPAALARLKSAGAQIFTTLEKGTMGSSWSGGVLKLVRQ